MIFIFVILGFPELINRILIIITSKFKKNSEIKSISKNLVKPNLLSKKNIKFNSIIKL